MSQQLTQNVSAPLTVLLSLDDAPVTGLVDTDVTAQLSKGGGAFSAFTLTGTNFNEIGNGAYTITLATGDVDTLGTLIMVVTGASIDQSTTIAQVVAATQASTAVSLDTCAITGHVTDAAGAPVIGASVSARVLGMPSIEQSVAALSTNLVTATTDSSGQFFLELVRLADVEIFIPAANYRRRLVVPNSASANLYEIA